MIYEDFEFILEQLGSSVKQTTYSEQQKLFAAAAILCLTFGRNNKLMETKINKHALTEYLDVLIEWETAIVI